MRPEFTNVDWTALARKVLVENPQQAWNELPGKLQASRDLLNQYEPGKGIDPRLMDQFMNLTGAFAPMGLTAYHGSPYLFRQFDLAKRGTGEGAQAYGTGAGYTAQARELADVYSPRDYAYEEHLQKLYDQAQRKRDFNSMEVLESAMMHKRPAELRQQYGSDAESIIKNIEQVQPKSYLYKGDIPDEIIPKFVDWDRPIKEQSEEVRKLAKKYKIDPEDLGGDLIARVGKGIEGTKIMEKAGIKGIRYLEPGTRGVGGGTSNFIPFRPEDYKIQEINDIPLDEWIRKGLLGP
jgi:hypothetical protein